MTQARTISRRDFLIGAGGLAVAATVAGPGLAAATARPRRRGPSRVAWRELSSTLDGRLLLPGERGYTANRLPWNLAAAEVAPAAVALVASAFDVQTCVRWAQAEGLPVMPRCGGHSYAGYSTTPGLLIDLQHLEGLSIDDDDVATVGAGMLLGPIDAQTNPQGIVLPAGRCVDVGVSGLVLGGGFGFNARKFGLTSDNLISTEIVTADGELRTADERSERDLFWALRGGGGGNFGINTSYRFQTHRVPRVSVYRLAWSPDDAVAAWSAMQQVTESAPDEFSTRLGISISEDGPLPGAVNKSVVTLGQFIGPVADMRDLLAPVLAAAPTISETIEEMSLADGTVFLAETQPPMAFLDKSAYLPTGLPEASIETLVAWMDEFPPEAREGDFTLFSWGGAINRIPQTATAFAHRTAAFVAEGCTVWHAGDPPSLVARTKDWIVQLYQQLADDFDGSAYQNFMDPTQEDWLQAYYGDNLDRLIDVKTAVDPGDFFRFPQSIPTRSGMRA